MQSSVADPQHWINVETFKDPVLLKYECINKETGIWEMTS